MTALTVVFPDLHHSDGQPSFNLIQAPWNKSTELMEPRNINKISKYCVGKSGKQDSGGEMAKKKWILFKEKKIFSDIGRV